MSMFEEAIRRRETPPLTPVEAIEDALRADLVMRGMSPGVVADKSLTVFSFDENPNVLEVTLTNELRYREFNELCGALENVRRGTFSAEAVGIFKLASPDHNGKTVAKIKITARTLEDLVSGINQALLNKDMQISLPSHLHKEQ